MIRTPIKGGMTNIATFDHGTFGKAVFADISGMCVEAVLVQD